MVALTSWLIPLSTGLVGVVAGTFLRPLVEDWHKRKQQTITLVEENEGTEFNRPDEKLKITIGDLEFEKVFNRSFSLENRTKRSFKNFKLSLGTVSADRSEGNFAIFVEPGSADAHFTISHQAAGSTFDFEHLSPGSKVSGTLISDRPMRLSARVDQEYEVVKTAPPPTLVDQAFVRIVTGAALAALATSIAAALQ